MPGIYSFYYWLFYIITLLLVGAALHPKEALRQFALRFYLPVRKLMNRLDRFLNREDIWRKVHQFETRIPLLVLFLFNILTLPIFGSIHLVYKLIGGDQQLEQIKQDLEDIDHFIGIDPD